MREFQNSLLHKNEMHILQCIPELHKTHQTLPFSRYSKRKKEIGREEHREKFQSKLCKNKQLRSQNMNIRGEEGSDVSKT